MQNSHCYTFEKRQYSNGFLDSFVDATYILTMENSKRKDDYENQLKEFIPTKTIYIVHNKGYKKCNKILPKEIPPYDLIDSYLNTMNHSLENNYNNILILEDDFIFNKKIKDNKIINDIKYLFDNNLNKSFYFSLGLQPTLFIPFSISNIYIGLNTGSTHANIYSKNIRYKILNDNNINLSYHFDLYLSSKYINYFYKIPLCYQTYPETENQKYWFNDNPNSLSNKYLGSIIPTMYKLLNINSEPEKGFYRLYNMWFFINYLLFIIIILFLAFVIYYIIKFFHKKKFLKKKYFKK